MKTCEFRNKLQAKHGWACPICGHQLPKDERVEMTVEGAVAYRVRTCGNCGSSWEEMFRLENVNNIFDNTQA